MRLILLNGPPRCGKDTALGLIAKHQLELSLGMVRHIMVAEPLKDACHAFLNARPANDADKDKPIGLYGIEMTWRQFYIHMSEKCYKPLFGIDIFGRIAVAQLVNPSHTYVTSDTGFHEETAPLIKRVGGKHTLLVTLSRPGTSFDNDSRSYLQVDELERLTGSRVSQCLIDNRHSLEMYEAELCMRIQQWRDKL